MKKNIILLPLLMLALASCGGNNNSTNGGQPSISDSQTSTITVEEKTVTLTVSSLGLVEQSYADGTVEVEGKGFQFVELGNYGNGIQMRTNSKDPENIKKSSLWNTAAFSKGIESVQLNVTNGKAGYSNENALIFEFANDVSFANSSTTMLNTVKDQTAYTITPEASTYKFVRITINIKYSLYFESIVINPVK